MGKFMQQVKNRKNRYQFVFKAGVRGALGVAELSELQ